MLKAYKVKMPCGREFTCITETHYDELPAAIFERFRRWPLLVEKL